jgi:hypothetical protein
MIVVFFAIGVTLALTSCKPKNEITQDELVRRTQELFDSVAPGNQAPWKKYFADDCMYFDEKGRNTNKAALVADVTPMPPGFSGSIKIEKAQSHIERNVAVLSYDMDEKETIYGQELSARYHATDTWMRRNGQWQIIAGQVLRCYEELKAAFFFATATTAEWMRSSTGEITRMWFGKIAVKIAHGNGHGGTVHDLRCARNRVQQRRGSGSRLLPRRSWIQVGGCRPGMADFCLASGGGRVSSRRESRRE